MQRGKCELIYYISSFVYYVITMIILQSFKIYWRVVWLKDLCTCLSFWQGNDC